MEISLVDRYDDDVSAQLFALQRAVHAADCPDRPAPCPVAWQGEFHHPRPRTVVHRRVVRVDGRVIGALSVGLPTHDNTHYAHAEVTVHPRYRRRGIGSALLAEGMSIARAAGRTTLTAAALGPWPDGPRRPEAGARFLAARGFTLALTEVERKADLTAVDPATEQRWYAEAAARAGGYELVGWTGRVPEELLAGVARLDSSFLAEAPIGELELAPERLDADYQRAQDDASLARGLFLCGVVARHRESGEIVANTVLCVATEPGDTANQWITLVAPAHRGHRLGLLTKLENHRQLRRERPAVRWIYTGNADVNAHMIAINEQLGFRVVDAWREYQRKL